MQQYPPQAQPYSDQQWAQLNTPLTGKDAEDFEEQQKIYEERITELATFDLSCMTLESLQAYFLDNQKFFYDTNDEAFYEGKRYRAAFKDPSIKWYFIQSGSDFQMTFDFNKNVLNGSMEEMPEYGWYFDVS